MPVVQAGTVTVTAGSLSAIITGTFEEPYEASFTPAWNTIAWVVQASKTSTQFVTQFSTPPSVDSAGDWSVVAAEAGVTVPEGTVWGFVT